MGRWAGVDWEGRVMRLEKGPRLQSCCCELLGRKWLMSELSLGLVIQLVLKQR